MAKARTTAFFCKECGYESAKWAGQCPACKEWNTMVEEPADRRESSGRPSAGSGRIRPKAKPVLLRDVSMDEQERTPTGFSELDRVLGGGIVSGSLVLIGGDPGIGKSTLVLQVCRNLAAAGKALLYVSGEESLKQIRLRADRIGEITGELLFLAETNLDTVEEAVTQVKPDLVVIDSIQTMYREATASAPGSVGQVRECTNFLLQLAKGTDTSILIVGHVTKEGVVAGPRMLEHMVDTVLYFEGEKNASYRVLRGVKNRFGSTNEIGVFEMRQEGLVQVENPSEYLLSGRPEGASGAVVACSLEGTRPVLLEVQALVARTSFGMPRRTAAGIDYNRVNLLMAVLEKRCRCEMSGYDAYVNIAGGIRLNEPALDLAVVLALVSSLKDRPVNPRVIVFGEVGLAGEIRAVAQTGQRVSEAVRLGFEGCILPQISAEKIKRPEGFALYGVKNVREAISLL